MHGCIFGEKIIPASTPNICLEFIGKYNWHHYYYYYYYYYYYHYY